MGKIWNNKVSFLKWFKGFFSDSSGQSSRKAAAGYIGLYLIYSYLQKETRDINELIALISFVGSMFGFILAERFNKNGDSTSKSNKETSQG